MQRHRARRHAAERALHLVQDLDQRAVTVTVALDDREDPASSASVSGAAAACCAHCSRSRCAYTLNVARAGSRRAGCRSVRRGRWPDSRAWCSSRGTVSHGSRETSAAPPAGTRASPACGFCCRGHRRRWQRWQFVLLLQAGHDQPSQFGIGDGVGVNGDVGREALLHLLAGALMQFHRSAAHSRSRGSRGR